MGVGFDAVSPNSSGQNGNNSSTSWSHTNAGNYVLVGIALSSTADGDTVTATYDGVAMTSVGKVHCNNGATGFIQLFELVNPPAGAKTVALSWTNVSDFIAGAVSYTVVDPANPRRTTSSAFGNGVSASLALASDPSDMCAWVAASNDAISAPTKTGRWLNNLSIHGAMQDAAGGAGTVTGAWTINADNWAIIGVSMQPQIIPPGYGEEYVVPAIQQRRAA